MYFNKFDICEAWYLALADCHCGQASPEYARLSRMGRYFTPGASFSTDTLSVNARQIYAVACVRLLGESLPDPIDLDALHDCVVAQASRAPTAEGYLVGLQLLATGEDIATVAGEVTARGLTTELDGD